MYVINDIELLGRLGRHKILDFILIQCNLSITGIRLTEYSTTLQRQMKACADLGIKNVDELFHLWIQGKTKNLSMGDLSTMYLTLADGAKLIVSEEDSFVEESCIKFSVPTIRLDEFIIKNIKDEKMMQLYNLIKVA